MSEETFELRRLGQVRIDAGEFLLDIEEPFRPALLELGGFSHVNVLWWADQVDLPFFRDMTVAERPYRNAPAAIGILATRSPARPNPLALSTASLISVDIDRGLVRVGYIDADAGSPIVDLKPYLPATDRVRNARYPEWAASWPEWYEDSATFDWGAVFENAQ